MKHEILKKLHACEDGVVFAEGFKSLQRAWNACERGDWMLWLYARLPGMDHRKLVMCACDCARRSLKYITNESEKHPLEAIKAAEAWVKNPGKEETAAAATYAYYANYAAEFAFHFSPQ